MILWRKGQPSVHYLVRTTHRQNTNFTTLGILREGFRVSPAVIPRLSVPPSATVVTEVAPSKQQKPTSKAGGHKNTSKSSEASYKRGTRYSPIAPPYVSVLGIHAYIDKNPEYYEQNDSNDFQG